MFDDSKRLDTLEAAVKKLEAGVADSQTFDTNFAKGMMDISKELRTLIGNAEKAIAAVEKTADDLAARVKTLEGQVSKLSKR